MFGRKIHPVLIHPWGLSISHHVSGRGEAANFQLPPPAFGRVPKCRSSGIRRQGCPGAAAQTMLTSLSPCVFLGYCHFSE